MSAKTFSYIQEINQLSTRGKFMLFESLFTNIPFDEHIEPAVKYIYRSNPGLTMSPTDFITLFSLATAQTHFLFKGLFYDQIHGVAMGSLALVHGNLFVRHHEKIWLNNYKFFLQMDVMLMTRFHTEMTPSYQLTLGSQQL